VDSFSGIRYAQPPLGALRFRPAQPIVKSFGAATASAFGSPCLQDGPPFDPNQHPNPEAPPGNEYNHPSLYIVHTFWPAATL
jgi:carboxylesterase type B